MNITITTTIIITEYDLIKVTKYDIFVGVIYKKNIWTIKNKYITEKLYKRMSLNVYVDQC